MSQNKFQSLLMQYGRSVGMGQSADLILEGHPIEVDGVIFSLDYRPLETPSYFTVYCDLGVLSNIDTVEVQRALLRMNMTLYMTQGLCLTVSPVKKGHAIFSFNLVLADVTAKTFCATLESMAKFSIAWRRQWPVNLKRFSTQEAVRAAKGNAARAANRNQFVGK